MFGRWQAIAVVMSLESVLIICHYRLPEVLRGIGPTDIRSVDHLYMACEINPNDQGGVLQHVVSLEQS